VDAEDRQPIESWFNEVTGALASTDVELGLDYLSSLIADAADEDDSASGPSRERPYLATLVVRMTTTYFVSRDLRFIQICVPKLGHLIS